MATNKTFHVGLCLAGAVSAGAYTAGVIDYLVEALEEWQKRKNAGTPETPSHDVVIPVIGGASAGGMTGIILSSMVNQPVVPVNNFPQPLFIAQPQNRLYHSWVDLTDDDMFPRLLETSDIRKKEIYSLLNSSFIDDIAHRVVQSPTGVPVFPPYFEKHLKVFATLSNLQGFKYNIAFKSSTPGLNRYLMSRHNDFACFVLNKAEEEYGNDGWNPLDFIRKAGITLARDAAMATGAFPMGLRARTVTREGKRVNEIRWLKEMLSSNPFPEGLLETMNVDGGLLNNEPFEKVRDLLWDITGEDKQPNITHSNVKSSVLMIDPFPSETSRFDSNDRMFNVMGNTLNAVRNHLLAKPEHFEDAYNANDPRQFLIAPSRRSPSDPAQILEGSKAIACGSLGGFGGFIHKNFRIHDFFLGRANCEHFLRCHFTVPYDTTNPVFTEGYALISDKEKFRSPQLTDRGLQIIPLFTEAKKKRPMPSFGDSDWPAIHEQDVRRFDPMIRKRIESLLLNLDEYAWHTKFLLWAGAKVVLNRKISDVLVTRILKSLEEHQLIRS